jgi:hypothetical protein
VLPAHQWRFRGVSARTAELPAHHEGPLAELPAVIAARPGSVPWDFAAVGRYDGHLKVVAVIETMSHAVHLMRRVRPLAVELGDRPGEQVEMLVERAGAGADSVEGDVCRTGRSPARPAAASMAGGVRAQRADRLQPE